MKLIKTDSFVLRGVLIDAGLNTDDEIIVTVKGSVYRDRKSVTITTRIFKNRESYENGKHVARAIHTFPFHTLNLCDTKESYDHAMRNNFPALFYQDDNDHDIIVWVEYLEVRDDDTDVYGSVTVLTGDDAKLEKKIYKKRSAL